MTFMRAVGVCFDKYIRKTSSSGFQRKMCYRCVREKTKDCCCNCGEQCQLKVEIPRVDLDYIGTIEENAGRFYFRKHAIDIPIELLQALGNEYRRDGATCYDLQKVLLSYMPDLPGMHIDHISPWAYSQSCIDPFDFGKKITYEEFDANMRKKQNSLQVEFDTHHPLTGNENLSLRERRKNDYVQAGLERFRVESNRSYMYIAIRAIAYVGYCRTLDELKKKGESLKMYSTDNIGWTDYKYSISDDVVIRLQSNFGYGHSAYFRIVLAYKGIRIVAYSSYVNYYYANARELCRFTRRYSVSCWNWNRAFSFVEEVSNLAAQSKDAFVKKWIVGEVDEMVSGLHIIVERPDVVFDKWTAATSPLGTRILLDVMALDDGIRVKYKCYSDEMLMDFQAEKISGALDFLESLFALKEIYSEVDASIMKIRDMAKKLLPKIARHVAMAESHVGELGNILTDLQATKASVEQRIEQHRTAINLATQAACLVVKIPATQKELAEIAVNVEQMYRQNHPQLEEDEKNRVALTRLIDTTQEDKNCRENFLARLKKFREKIQDEKFGVEAA